MVTLGSASSRSGAQVLLEDHGVVGREVLGLDLAGVGAVLLAGEAGDLEAGGQVDLHRHVPGGNVEHLEETLPEDGVGLALAADEHGGALALVGDRVHQGVVVGVGSAHPNAHQVDALAVAALAVVGDEILVGLAHVRPTVADEHHAVDASGGVAVLGQLVGGDQAVTQVGAAAGVDAPDLAQQGGVVGPGDLVGLEQDGLVGVPGDHGDDVARHQLTGDDLTAVLEQRDGGAPHGAGGVQGEDDVHGITVDLGQAGARDADLHQVVVGSPQGVGGHGGLDPEGVGLGPLVVEAVVVHELPGAQVHAPQAVPALEHGVSCHGRRGHGVGVVR
jgi:hypothetical protein